MGSKTFSNSLKALMPSNFSVANLNVPRIHHLSKKTFINFDIFKKGLDLSKDVIRSHIHLIQKLDRYLPLLGLVIGLTGLSLQLLIIICDKQHSKNTKIAASVIFGGLIMLAVTACMLAVKAPIVSGALGITISFFTFLSDCYHFRLNLKQYFKLKERHKQMSSASYEEEKLARLKALSQQQQVLYKQLKQNLTQLLAETDIDKNQKHYSEQLSITRRTLLELVDCDTQMKTIRTEPEAIAKLMQQQSTAITMSAFSLTINVISISLAITCLATCGMVPWGFSILLALVFVVDLVEFTKNVQAKRRFDKIKQDERTERDNIAKDYLEHAAHDIKADNPENVSSYHKMGKSLPKQASPELNTPVYAGKINDQNGFFKAKPAELIEPTALPREDALQSVQAAYNNG